MSSYMTSLHIDLNEAAKCVDMHSVVDMPLALLAALSSTLINCKIATTFGLTDENPIAYYSQLKVSSLGKESPLVFSS